MSHLVFFDTLSDRDYKAGEARKIEYWANPPEVGDRVSLGSERLWSIVGVDRYESPENTREAIYLVHCAIGEVEKRANWFRVRAYRDRQPNLQLFLGEGLLLQVRRNLTGDRPAIGSLLPQYHPQEKTVTSQPWGIAAIDSYIPDANIVQPCYLTVHLCECVYVPEVLESEKAEHFVKV
ncbi:MAG: hypothetical protein J7647_28190 [Cyanobacteria bacterium SBLK]|nr:hypothetical protein [Cyanobacteria bacterium SBLK]